MGHGRLLAAGVAYGDLVLDIDPQRTLAALNHAIALRRLEPGLIHSSLGYLPPVKYESLYFATTGIYNWPIGA